MDAARREALQEAFRFLESRGESALETLVRWCNQNSGSEHLEGLARMAGMLAEDFKDLGVPLQRLPLQTFTSIDDTGQAVPRTTGDLLLWEHRPDLPRRVLLMIHYDTVYSPDAIPRICRREPDGRLVGPGTADAKGGLLVMHEALLALRRFDLDDGIGWTAAANPDEEIGSPGSSAWMAEHARQFDMGLVFEPTLPDGSLVAARKGSGNFTIVVRGRSAHAGRDPDAGRNAVVHLCRLMSEVDRLNQNGRGTTVNVARVRGGGALNRVPDLAVGRVNARVLDCAAQDEFLRQLADIVASYDADEGFQAELHGHFQSPPKPVDAAAGRLQQRMQAAARMAGRAIRWRDTGGACDGSKLAAAGLPNIDTLGGTGDQLHSPSEWVDPATLVPAAKTVVALVASYAAEAAKW